MIRRHVDIEDTPDDVTITISKRGTGRAIADAIVGHLNSMIRDDPELDTPFEPPETPDPQTEDAP